MPPGVDRRTHLLPSRGLQQAVVGLQREVVEHRSADEGPHAGAVLRRGQNRVVGGEVLARGAGDVEEVVAGLERVVAGMGER